MRRRLGGKAFRSMRWRTLLPLLLAVVVGAVLSPSAARAIGPPVIVDVVPDTGLAGTVVTITGEHFTGATSVTFGGRSAGFIVHNDRSIQATTPILSAAGPVGIVVTSPDGASPDTAADDFTYVVPSLKLGGTSELRLRASGDPGVYTVALSMRPTGPVTVSISGIVGIDITPSTLTFSSADYATPKQVTLRAADHPDHSRTRTSVITHIATGGGYDGSGRYRVPVTIVSDNRFMIVVLESAGSTELIEGGGPDFLSFRLTGNPGGDATVTVTPDAQLTTSSSAFRFDASNWSSRVEFAVFAVDDDDPEGDHTGILTFTLEGGSLRAPPVEISVSIADDHSPAVRITESDGATVVAEDGGHDSYTVALRRRPSGPVTVAILPDDDLRVSPARVVFRPHDWAQPRTVLVEAVDDDHDESEHVHHIHHLTTGLGAVSLSVTIIDNDTPDHELVPLSAGLSLIGWFGAPTTARAILDGNPDIGRIWIWDQVNGWRGDSPKLPPGLRRDIPIARGDGFWLFASADTELVVPLR